MEDEGDRRRGVQAVEVTVTLLAALAEAGGPMGLNQLAASVDLAPAKAHRYLSSLVASGMVQHRKSGAYDLGPRAARIGTAAVARLDVVNRASDALPDLVDASGCTAMLSVWGAYGATVVRWEKATPQLITALGVGSTLPLTRSATGLAFLGWLPERLLSERLDIEAPDLRGEALARRQEEVRAAGLTEASESFIPGLYALAAPVLDLQGQAEGVVTLVDMRPDIVAPNSRPRRVLSDFLRTLAPDVPKERQTAARR